MAAFTVSLGIAASRTPQLFLLSCCLFRCGGFMYYSGCQNQRSLQDPRNIAGQPPHALVAADDPTSQIVCLCGMRGGVVVVLESLMCRG